MSDSREQQLEHWVNLQVQRLALGTGKLPGLEVVSGDASFRRYFRARPGSLTCIAVDAPPANEDSGRFVRIAELFREAGARVPAVLAADFEQGFMLLEDFGDAIYLDRLLDLRQRGDLEEAERLYQSAFDTLLDIQQKIDKKRLDPYDRDALHREMCLFEDWFCGSFLGLQLSAAERERIAATQAFLEDAALAQPQVAVHRDYHSRNLMLVQDPRTAADSRPGVIDFQDALCGAYTYDLVSLLRDAYIRWEPAQVRQWALQFLEQASSRGLVTDIGPSAFLRDFDLMGLQRQLKVMGIFARLAIRDKKPRYLADIPLVMQYFLEVARHYSELREFIDWFEQSVLPEARTKLKLGF